MDTGEGRGWMQGGVDGGGGGGVGGGGGGRYLKSKSNEKQECRFCFFFLASYWLAMKSLMGSIFTMQSVCLVGWLSKLKVNLL